MNTVSLGAIALAAISSSTQAQLILYSVDVLSSPPASASAAPARLDPFAPGVRTRVAGLDTFGDTYDSELFYRPFQSPIQGPYVVSGLGGQSVPYDGTTRTVGTTFFSGDPVFVASRETPLGDGTFRVTLAMGLVSGTEIFPTGLTGPGGVGLSAMVHQIGTAGGDRDGTIDDLNLFPDFPSWDILDATLTLFSGTTVLRSFTPSGLPVTGLTSTGLFIRWESAAGLGATQSQFDLLVRPVPAPGMMAATLAAAALAARRRRR